jgi:TP901 family phage tail tape measure protein
MSNTLKLEVQLSALDKLSAPMRKIFGGARDTAAEFRRLSDQLKDLGRAQRDLAEFRELRQAMQNTGAAMQDARSKADALAREFYQASASIRPLRELMQSVKQRTNELSAAYRANKMQMLQMQQQVEQTGRRKADLGRRMNALSDQMRSGTGDVAKLRIEYDRLHGEYNDVLNDQIAQERQQRALREQYRASGQQLRESRRQLTLTSNEYKAASGPVDALGQQLNEARSRHQRLSSEFSKGSNRLRELKRELNSAGIGTKDLAGEEASLASRVSATTTQINAQRDSLRRLTEQQNRLNQARDKYQQLSQTATGLAASGAAGLGSAYALSRPLRGVVDAFAPNESAESSLRVSMMTSDGQVSQEFERVAELAKELGDILPGTTADFQNMMTMLKRQGMSNTAILGGLGEATAYAGVLFKMQADDAAEFSAKMQDATRTTEADMLSLMDTIQRAYYAGTDPRNMLQGFTKVAPALSLMRKEGLAAVQELAPLLAMFDQAGMAGEQSGNALRKAIQGALKVDDVKSVNDDLKAMGSSIKFDFTDGKGEFGGLEKMFAQLKQLEKLTSAQRVQITADLFGDDAETLQVINTMMARGIEGYREMAQKMGGQASLQQRINEDLKTLTNHMDAAGGSFTNMLADIGRTVAPDLKELIKLLGETTVKIGDWVKANPELTSTIFKVVAVLAGLFALLGSLGLAIGAVLLPLATMRYAMSLIGIRAGSLLGLLGGLRGLLNPLGKAAAWLGGVFRGTLVPALRLVGSVLLGVGKALFANPIGIAIGLIAGAAWLIYQYWEPIKAFFSELWETIKTLFNQGVAAVTQFINNWAPLDTFKSVFSSVFAWFGSLPATFMGFGTDMINGLTNGIKSMAGSVKDAVINTADSAVKWFQETLGINSPSRVFMQMGGFMGQGAALGIEREQDSVARAVRQLAAGAIGAGAIGLASPAMALQPDAIGMQRAVHQTLGQLSVPAPRIDRRPPLAARAPAVPAVIQGDTITIQITPAPGADPREIALAVRAELERRDRQKAARMRSSMYDYGD